MKKPMLILAIFLTASVLNAQQKYALVIGNSNYTGISALKNPVNDANDMEAALKGLGFAEVIKVLNGDLEQMENAVLSLGRKLSASTNSYGFFFYAGHGVQSNGENYLIPVEAGNILNETHLRTRAVPLEFVMSELNRAGNEFNMIILDACRDNPFGWSRSGSRGLSVVSRAPTGSMVFYATATGSVANDGDGRNGLFTSQLLNNIKTPGLSVRDVFERTGADVMAASNGRQKPELADSYFKASTAYLGSRPSQPGPAPSPAPNPGPSPNPSPAYQIGDRGPAGGYVFYDKGGYSNGWRYLEAAPTDASTNVSWGILNAYEEKTRTDVGSGRANTAYLLEDHTKLKESGRAAQAAAAYKANGFEDWFLPSYEELLLMYQNLKTRGLGNFSNNWYWSSSDCNDRLNAQSVYFSNGAFTKGDKKQTASVRAARWF
jgi:hypothetical protein